ncbi:MAG: nitrite/sulfite reductase [Alphaproteobacteria bacterium]
MYQYDQFDNGLVSERVDQFRGQVERRTAGNVLEEEFRPHRLMNGLYLQLHAYMLRVAVPYGTLNGGQMRMLADCARKYDKGYGHFTTRQNIQFNWPRLDDVSELLKDLSEVEMHAIQTSGNCIRNITTDQYAGATPDEVEDPRITGEVLRQWSTFHPEFSFLPRKFKIAITATENDRAAMRFHDIGIEIVKNDAGDIGYAVWVGGGQGRTPVIAKKLNSFVPRQDLICYLEAVLRTYNMLGRRDNLYKARIKITVNETGVEEFTRLVDEEFAAVKQHAYEQFRLRDEEFSRVAAFFSDPAYESLAATSSTFEDAKAKDTRFAAWAATNIAPHKVPGYAIANISLKPAGGIPGDATSEQMDLVADLADRYSFSDIRVTHEQNLVLPHVKFDDLYALWQALDHIDLGTANLGLVTDMIVCPGLDYCNLANARSIPVGQMIDARFADLNRQHDIGELKVKISGCINACGHHHVGHIGILGVDKKGTEYYQITLGGSADENAAVGKIVGRAFGYDEVADAVETVVTTYVNGRDSKEETFLSYVGRVGLGPFKEALYGSE